MTGFRVQIPSPVGTVAVIDRPDEGQQPAGAIKADPAAKRQGQAAGVDRAIPELREAGIVLRGTFNPLIFRPDWLVSKGLVPAAEVEQAVAAKTIGVIHPEVVMYQLPSMTVQVRPEMMIVETSEDPFIRICDLVLGCFAALPETPLNRAGINLRSHFPTRGEDHSHAIGDTLAPKDPWKLLLGPDQQKQRTGGMKSLTMERRPRPDNLPGSINVKVGPSSKVRFGIYVAVNDHYEIQKPDEPLNAAEIMTMLKENWEASISRAMQYCDAIMAIR